MALFDWWPTSVSRTQFQQLENKVNAQQTKIDELTAKVDANTAVLGIVKIGMGQINVGITGLETRVVDLVAEVAALKAAQQAGEQLDFSKLEASVAGMVSEVEGVRVSANAAAENIASAPEVG